MDIFTTTPAFVITTTTICMVAALSVGGTCALIIALIVKELRSASKTEEQEPTLMAIMNRIKANGSLTIALVYLLITLSLVVSMMMAKALS